MKYFYWVRHGESEANLARSHGSMTTPLTEKGREQARFIARRASKLPIQKVVSSTMTRAKQTGEIIAQELGLPLETSALFIETQGPSNLEDAAYNDPRALDAFTVMRENYGAPGFRFEDAEMFEDHTKRAQAALAFLAAQEEEHILLVTHGLFLRILAAHVMFGPEPSSKECHEVMQRLKTINTGLTIVEYGDGVTDYTGAPIEHPWRMLTWNDHAHLAD